MVEFLGSDEFKWDYYFIYVYFVGGMYCGIVLKEMVVKLLRVGMMGFFGIGGLSLNEVEDVIFII